MKGALWTLSSNVFGKYAVAGNYLWFGLKRTHFLLPLSEPRLALALIKNLFVCQDNEKVSDPMFV
jgi:hypothetical protein